MTSEPSAKRPIGGAVGTDGAAPLRGGWLVGARVGWVVLTLLVLALSALALPDAHALLRTVCQAGATCVSNQLAPADVAELRRLGLSLGFPAAYTLGLDVGTLVFYTVLAALILWRRSTDRMAVFCAYMLVLFGSATYTGLLDIGLRVTSPIWFWLVGGLELLAQVSVPIFFLLFPNGRFVPRWTRWAVLVYVAYEVWYVFLSSAYLGSISGPLSLVFAVLLLCLVGFQIYRYWRVSNVRERQQTKWVVFGLASALGGLALVLIAGSIFVPQEVKTSSLVGDLAAQTVTDGLLLLIPISIVFAILRSRLFDIDVIIRRTLIYGALTAALAAVYFAAVIGAQHVAQALTGRTDLPPVVVVASTLLIAALFTPLRRGIQAGIDRRFYRRKYDAARTLAAFGATLRTETDLPTLSAHLEAAVDETMRPAHVSLWLAPPHMASQPPRAAH
jgi:hypothetical protein